MRFVIGLLLALLGMGCTHGVFSRPTLTLHYKSPLAQVPPKAHLLLQAPQVSFLQDFIPPYYQHQYTKALQKDIPALLAHLGYTQAPNAPKAHLKVSVRLAFKSTPPTLKETKAMLKASGNEYVDPVRVLRMLHAQSTVALECAQAFPCGLKARIEVLEPVWRANPLDSDPNTHPSDEMRYNDALIETLNKLYQKSLQTLETQIHNPKKE
ncbi:hypothetical protein [Helicobacter labacensis]|uniref:hypothetical protein n=1 Tax=Helicobacter labacensis TaxID=2316079 RepID=UPI000EABD282|nr:hypothetical protein [Helicobacter labacensis]